MRMEHTAAVSNLPTTVAIDATQAAFKPAADSTSRLSAEQIVPPQETSAAPSSSQSAVAVLSPANGVTPEQNLGPQSIPNTKTAEHPSINPPQTQPHTPPSPQYVGHGKKNKGGRRAGVMRRQWHEEEDDAIAILVSKHGTKQWSLIARLMEREHGIVGRTGKQCRERYTQVSLVGGTTT